MSVKMIIENMVNKNHLGLRKALEEELNSRIQRSLKPIVIHEGDEIGFRIGGVEHEKNHADAAELHREMAERHRKIGGRFHLKAAIEHDKAAKEQENAADHEYSFERWNKTHTKAHEPNIIAARAAFDRADKQSKAAFSASHLASAEEQD